MGKLNSASESSQCNMRHRQKWKFWKASTHKPKTSSDETHPPLPFWQLFRYSTVSDKILVFIALLSAILHGALFPLLSVFFGDAIDDFDKGLSGSDGTVLPTVDITDSLADTTKTFLIVSSAAFVLSFFQLSCSVIVSNRIGNNLRKRFFANLIAQDCDFFDHHQTGSLTHIVVNDIHIIQQGIGDKLATATQYFSSFVVGICLGFVNGWKLASVILSTIPIIFIAGILLGNRSSRAASDGLGAYAEAGGIASEILSLIRTVTVFGAQQNEADRYITALEKAYKSSVRAIVSQSIGIATAIALLISNYGLAFWVGSRFAKNGDMSTGDVLTVFFSVTIGAGSLGTAGPAFKSFGIARAAAHRVYEIIERKSVIDPSDTDEGLIPTEQIRGEIVFDTVDFNYQNRIVEEGESTLVLDNFNLHIAQGTSEAFVGKSGSGKSTVARLIQRFYDPLNGKILLDGNDVRELNVKWLRSQMGVVAQTPSLFKMSIKENIALGAGCDFNRDTQNGGTVISRRRVSDEDIIQAAKMANAHDFILKLPEKYDTVVGERGAMLSGGQKQRICIARALIRNPKILILDESTASLDTASEKIVQDALEKAKSGRTTITIAHRLTTVKNCDSISVMQDGKIVERASHDNLLAKPEGIYKQMFELQKIEKAKIDKEIGHNSDSSLTDDNVGAHQSTKENTEMTSVTKHLDVESTDENKPDIDKGLFLRTLKNNRPEWPFILLGILGSTVVGLVWPLMSIPLVEFVFELLTTQSDGKLRKWSLAFVVIAGIGFVANSLQHSMLGIAGEKLIKRIRIQAFQAVLKQEIGYFDLEENSLANLTTRLSSDAQSTKGLTGDLFGVSLNVIGSLTCSLTIAFTSCWRLALVVLAIIPGVVLGGYLAMRSSANIDRRARKNLDVSNSIATEAADNITTVRGLGIEDYFTSRYNINIDSLVGPTYRKAGFTSIAFGFSEFCIYLIWYATFKAGASFVENGYCTLRDMLQSAIVLMYGAMSLGKLSAFAPDVGASRLGATNLYRLIDRNSQIDPSIDEGYETNDVNGSVTAENIHFEYPRRPDVPVLNGLDLSISAGKTLAIVGSSGHGKSTIVSLLQRFYGIRVGEIRIDNQNICNWNVSNLRSHMGLVSQEPELFNRSVFDNIVYGMPHVNGTAVSEYEVIEAAKLANAHEFIESLPQGYNTLVGPRGEALSGGQRQRIAIARCLIRKPAILLLDEATSALDSGSEKLIQQALDRAANERTSIIIAHRLSTIRHADVIAVVRKGRVVESGTHEELLRRNGFYAELVQHQLTEV